MGLTMNKILSKFDDCDVFSLTGGLSGRDITISDEDIEMELDRVKPKNISKYLEKYLYRYTITEEEFDKNIIKQENEVKNRYKEICKLKKLNYPNFDKLYDEIKKECCDFDNDENKAFYVNTSFNEKEIEEYRKIGFSEEEIEEKKNNFFRVSFIGDQVGKTTKYGKYGNEDFGFFQHFYRDVASIIDLKKRKDYYCIKNGHSPIEHVPFELRDHLLYYEVSSSNAVTITSGLMINYYFKFNDETKKYLLKFRNDFCLEPLNDLTIYKDGEIKFRSCTHEGYNSIKNDYREMSDEDILDFINDELFELKHKDEIIEIINKLIVMNVGTVFSFKELGASSKTTMIATCTICEKLKLQLYSSENKESKNIATITENGTFENIKHLPAVLCELDDLIEKRQ